ncbi:hypothetical protein GC163_19810 [bacterium]|nr:hypothetical protein [bacterium]
MSLSENPGSEPRPESVEAIRFLYEHGQIPPDVLIAEAEIIRKRRRRASGASQPGEPWTVEQARQAQERPPGEEWAPSASTGDETEEKDCAENNAPPVGLSLSSGGLRSCTFTLGFVQALHHSGELKNVDYLSSVSGGGFVAGHVTSLADQLRLEHPNSEAGAFHQNAGKAGDVLGVKKNGQILPGFRFSAVGEYLYGSVWELPPLAFRYLCSTVPLVICTIAPIGFLMTLAALFWRSFDYTNVRNVLNLLGADILADRMNWGQDALVSYLPAFLLTGILIIYGAAVAILGLVHNLLRWKTSLLGWLVKAGGILVIVTLVGWVMSMVAYASNGWSAPFGSDIGLTLQSWTNNYATYLSALLTLPFIFSRRLADSAKANAPTWQKIFSRAVVSTVLTCTPLVLFYWMVRENLSEHAEHRLPTLLRDDVLDWPRFANLDEELGVTTIDDLNRVAAQHTSDASNTPTSPNISPDIEKLLPIADPAIRHAAINGRLFGLSRFQMEALFPSLVSSLDDDRASDASAIREYLENCSTQDLLRADYIRHVWNPWLANASATANLKTEFATERLLRELAKRHPQIFAEPISLPAKNDQVAMQGTATPLHAGEISEPEEQPTPSRSEAIEDFLTAACQHPRYSLSAPEATVFRTLLLTITPGRNQHGVAISEDFKLNALVANGSLNERTDIARFNRLLLETLYPDVIRKRTMVSTPIVIAADQAARCYWLLTWWLAILCGWLINANLHSPLYEYYRARLVRSFLSPSKTVSERAAVCATELESGAELSPEIYQEKSLWAASRRSLWPGRSTPRLSHIEPWEAGAPFPIFVATMSLFQRLKWMAPSKVNSPCDPNDVDQAALADEIPPMTFTPLHSGSYALGYRPTESYCNGELSLEDAVALSGAPITPMVTKSLPMRLTLGMVNARLGMWLPLPARETALSGLPSVNLPNVFATMLDCEAENQVRKGISDSPFHDRDKDMLAWAQVISLWLFLAIGGTGALIGLAGWSRVVADYSALQILEFSRSAVVTFLISAVVLMLIGGILLPVWSFSWFRLPSIVCRLFGGQVAHGAKSLREIMTGPLDYRPVVDGCFHDPFGLEELLLRRCSRVYIVDGGRNNDEWQMTALAEALRMMEERHGIRLKDQNEKNNKGDSLTMRDRMVVLEPDEPLLRSGSSKDLRIQDQHFIKLTLQYPEGDLGLTSADSKTLLRATEVDVYYCQMSLTGDEPLDILNYARRTKTFPNEPNANQFFTADQSETFRRLGYHIGEKLCEALKTEGQGQPQKGALHVEATAAV